MDFPLDVPSDFLSDFPLDFSQTVLALRGSYGVGKAGVMIGPWIRSRLPRSSNTVNHNTKSMSPSKTHHEIYDLMQLL